MTCAGLAAHVELENSRDHDNGLRTVPVLEHCKFHCFSAVDEQAATKTSLILDHPVAAAVFANQEERGLRTTRRGRFTFVHGTSPLPSTMECVLLRRARITRPVPPICSSRDMDSRMKPA